MATYHLHDFRDALCLFRPKRKKWCKLHGGNRKGYPVSRGCPSWRRVGLKSTMPAANKILIEGRKKLFRHLLRASLMCASSLEGVFAHLALEKAA